MSLSADEPMNSTGETSTPGLSDTTETRVHTVKSWTHFFQAIKAGHKVHDLRKNDRDYRVGDVLKLMEYDNVSGRYTGEFVHCVITYITDERVPCAFSSAVLEKGYSILSLKRLKRLPR